MKRLSIAALGLLLAAGCSSSSSTPLLDHRRHDRDAVHRDAVARAGERRRIAGPEAAASGTSTMDFNITRDASGTITAATVNFTATVQNFPATAVVNIAHIHTGAIGVERTDSGQHLGRSRRSDASRWLGDVHARGSAGDGRRGDDAVDPRQPGRLLLQHPHGRQPRGRDARAVGEAVA